MPAAQTGKRRRVLPIHPLLFAAFPLLALNVTNMQELPVRQIVRPLGFAIIGTLGIWAVLTLFTRHFRKSAIAASAIVLLFFTYGHMLNLLPVALRPFAAPGWTATACVLLFAILRTRRALYDATKVLNFMSVVIIAPCAWPIGTTLYYDTQRIGQPWDVGPGPAWDARRQRHVAAVSPPNLPDIYYIILDAYGRADSLKTFYGYDNGAFLRALEKRGFYVARESRANYAHTPLCLASALNMDYLDGLVQQLGPLKGHMEPVRKMLDNNAVADYLGRFGYRYVNIWTGYEPTRVDTADLVLRNNARISIFEGQVLSLSAAAAQTQENIYQLHRGGILTAFSNLDTVARLPYRKFVFAHILAPHPPFVFGPNGESVNSERTPDLSDGSDLVGRITRDEYRTGYVAQLQYVNRRIIEAIDAILQQSRQRPIIIIQGDHGSRMNLDWQSLARTDVREPFSILNAYYVPEKVRAGLYSSITPVNSFRVLLSRLLGADYPPLPDRSYYSTSSKPHDFVEVTLIPNVGNPPPPATSLGPAAN